ncbi:hypothetical protein BGZ94_004710 [Podila epigama]|nr:hypothetical protein BGZ94_004710 [Podila epigama]
MSSSSPPPLPQRRNTSFLEDVEPYDMTPIPTIPPIQDNDDNATPPPLPKRESVNTLTASTTPPIKESEKFLSPAMVKANGAYPEATLTSSSSVLSASPPSLGSQHVSPQPAPNSARSKEEVSFQFDRHVQEIRRRRTAVRKAPLPDRSDYERIEADSGKRVLDVRMYVQATTIAQVVMYFIESLARDDLVRKVEPLQWSKMKALLSRLYDTSNPAQSLGLYVERIMYWRNPPETIAWFVVYFTLWFYGLWLPGFIMLFALKILNNRFGFLGNFKETLNIPDPQATLLAHREADPSRKSTKMHSQLRELIHSKDLTDWISQMTKIWGPYCQALLEENICYLERLKNLFRWVRPNQTWRVLALLSFYIIVSTFFPQLVVPAIGLFIGTEFFILLPLQKHYPRFRHIFSPVELILWGVPTNAELAVEMLTQQQEESPEMGERKNSISSNTRSVVESLTAGEEGSRAETSSMMANLSPASRIKYEYQKRTRSRSQSNVSESFSMDEIEDKTEFHCLLRGKPGKLVITEEALQFRSAKLLGREIEDHIPWDMVDTIKKTKTMNIGLWSMPGIEVTDINGRVIVFQNVVKRDDAFRKLVNPEYHAIDNNMFHTVSTRSSPAPSMSSMDSDKSSVSSPPDSLSPGSPTLGSSAFDCQVEKFTLLLEKDTRVKVAGIDLDGILRGKIMAKSKFLSILKSGFGFCSVIFGWDMHDKVYPDELGVSNAANGYRDIIAKPDLTTFRRIPWEDDIPFFLLSFWDPTTGEPLTVCPRGVLKRVTDQLASLGMEAMCETPETLAAQGHTAPKPMTSGMFGYSLLRPSLNQDYFYNIFDQCKGFGVDIESFHTETGPGVYEAALMYDNATRMADKANLFKLSVKQLGLKHGIMPTFMAKPYSDQPGCSGHIHISIRDLVTKANLFASSNTSSATRTTSSPEWEKTTPGVESMSEIMKWFMAGLLTGLPSIMAILAPNINSYKRLVENYWAPVTVSWGVESRVSAIRVIGPPQCDPKGTRLEMRVSGADINPHLAIAACLATGLYGIQHRLSMPVAPTTSTTIAAGIKAERLPKSLKEAAQTMLAPGSIARKVLGDAFVEHYGATRLNEYRLWETAVTTWETKRYFELV